MGPKIFISYAHKDAPDASGVNWRDYVFSHLSQNRGETQIEAWADQEISGGQDWKKRILQALEACDVFVLLVSRHSLESDFIINTEVKRILERQEEIRSTEYPLLFPILITPCAQLDGHGWLKLPNIRPPDLKALSTFELSQKINERDGVMAGTAKEIHKAAAAGRPKALTGAGPAIAGLTRSKPSDGPPEKPHTPLDLDANIADLVGGKFSIASKGQTPPAEAPSEIVLRDLRLELVVSSPASTKICNCELIFQIDAVHVRLHIEGATLEKTDLTPHLKPRGYRAVPFQPKPGYAAAFTITAEKLGAGLSGSLFQDDWGRIGQLRPNAEGEPMRVSGDISFTPRDIAFIGDIQPAGKKLPKIKQASYESMVKALAKRVLEKHAPQPDKPFWPIEPDEK